MPSRPGMVDESGRFGSGTRTTPYGTPQPSQPMNNYAASNPYRQQSNPINPYSTMGYMQRNQQGIFNSPRFQSGINNRPQRNPINPFSGPSSNFNINQSYWTNPHQNFLQNPYQQTPWQSDHNYYPQSNLSYPGYGYMGQSNWGSPYGGNFFQMDMSQPWY